MDELSGKVAVVTGAASGIGLALTEAFVGEGMRVVMADVEEAALSREASRLGASGAEVRAVPVDVADADQVADLAATTLSAFGGVHVVCNNAGVAPGGPMLATTAAEWRWVFDVNVLGVAHGVRTFAPLLVEAGAGHIVNMASEAGLSTNSFLGLYCASKHAVVGLSEALYRELEGTGVGVSCVCPELVRTAIFHSERNKPERVEFDPAHNAAMAPLRQIVESGMEPAEVAAAVVAAVRADQFWVFTHPQTLDRAARRFHDIEAGQNPSGPGVA